MASNLALAGALASCSAPVVLDIAPLRTGGTPVRVTSVTGMPYTFADGAQAKKQADAQCGTGGVRATIYDRFEAGAWVYPGGCA